MDGSNQIPLSQLWNKLSHLITRNTANRKEWIDIQEDICFTLVEIRDRYPADIAFGQACTENRLGKEVLNNHERAAAIAMGREPKALRACLEATEQWSLQLIHREEFSRFANVSKPKPARENEPVKDKPAQEPTQDHPKPVKDKEPTKESKEEPVQNDEPKKSKEETIKPPTDEELKKPKRSKMPYEYKARKESAPEIVAEIQRMYEAEEPITNSIIAQMFGIGATQAGDAIIQAQVERRVRQEPRPLDESSMSATMQQRYEATLRVAKKRMADEIWAEKRDEFYEEVEKRLKYWRDKIEWATKVQENFRGLIERRDYRIILSLLHPDRFVNDPDETKQRAREAFELFKKLESKMVKPEHKFSGPPLPATVAELLAGRKNKHPARV